MSESLDCALRVTLPSPLAGSHAWAPTLAEAKASNANIPMTFQIYQGADLVRTETLTQDIIKVGKLPSSHFRIDRCFSRE